MIKITLKDGVVNEYEEGISIYEIAKSISHALAKNAMVGKLNNEIAELSTEIFEDSSLEILTFDDEEGRDAFRHTSSHILAEAVKKLYPEVKLVIGPPIENGFYYDFDIDRPFTEEDLSKIETEMQKIVKEDSELKKFILSRDKALNFMQEKNEPYKIDLINNLDEDSEISFYEQGDFVDLCAGPHLSSTGKIKAFKLIKVSGAYYKGDEKNKMLQRIYGTSFPKKSMLEEYLQMLEEAEKRDHRKLGRELDLFSTNEQLGGGLVLFHPKGAMLRHIVEDFWKKEHFKNGYDLVYSPHIGKSELWETSGHLDFYKDSMYSAIEVDGQDYYTKPMNCPFHILIYKSKKYSYRDLPLRWAELGTVYRYEKSGALHGLLRVRGFTQDDAHLICRPDQMQEEIVKTIKFCLDMLKTFGFDKFKVYLATKPAEKSVGDESMWNDAISALEKAVKSEKLECEVDEGGGAFYGPKIDIKIKDALNREWQCSTIQFDFNLPERFDLTYVDSDGAKKRPYMIHRALLGSIERFFGLLIEQYAGAFPTWLAPVQVKILTVSDKHIDYANEIADLFRSEEIRLETDFRNEKIGYKIREAELSKIPYMLVVGDKELENKTVSVRRKNKGDLGSLKYLELLEDIKKEVFDRKNY